MCLTPGFDYAELKRYDDLLKQTWAILDPEYSARVILLPLFNHSVQFLGHSGPLESVQPQSSGHLDPLTIPLSFFSESKVLASTIIFFEDTSCLEMEKHWLSANLPSLKDRLNKILRGKATSLATGFNILLLIPSGPLALFGFKIPIRHLISSVVHTIFDNLLRHFNSKVGSWQLSSF